MALIPTSTLIVQRFASALYDVQVGTTTMNAVMHDIDNNGLSPTLNGYFAASFGSLTNTQVANLLVTNLGIPSAGAAEAVAYVVGKLNGVPTASKGAVIAGILADFSNLTSHPVYGEAATAWNAQIAYAVAYDGTVDLPAGTVESTYTLTTGLDEVPNTATLIKGIVDGTTSANSTFSAADEIDATAANNTTLRLSVMDGGNAAYVYMNNVDNVDIHAAVAGETITFNAGDWTNIGAVNLASGVDGLTVRVDTLEDGADLSIASTVAGRVEGFYQSGMNAYLSNDGDGGASFVDGDVTPMPNRTLRHGPPSVAMPISPWATSMVWVPMHPIWASPCPASLAM